LQFQGDNAGLDKGEQIAPSIIERPKIIKDEAKRTVRFECKLRAKPEAKIKWLKEKKELTNGKKYKIETKKESENVFLLILEISVRFKEHFLFYVEGFVYFKGKHFFSIFKDFSAEDGGLYKVQAVNESGQSNANIHLSVEV